MTRIEENKRVIDEMAKRAKAQSDGTYEEMMVFQLGVIAITLVDISKSLAIIVNKKEGERA